MSEEQIQAQIQKLSQRNEALAVHMNNTEYANQVHELVLLNETGMVDFENVECRVVTRLTDKNIMIVHNKVGEKNVKFSQHWHTCDEYVYVLGGEITRLETEEKYEIGESYMIAAGEPHSFFIEAGSTFLVIFVPSLGIRMKQS